MLIQKGLPKPFFYSSTLRISGQIIRAFSFYYEDTLAENTSHNR